MKKNIAIKIQNLTKTYKLYNKPADRMKESLHPLKKKYHKKFHALNNVSFEVKKGETVGIIGKNGSGKSTLLKIITGVLTPSGGRVVVQGKISAILELGAGFNPEMTGIENIYLNTSINGMNKKQTNEKIDDIIAFAELGQFIHQPMKTYSSGMKSRLAFAVSININPDILIIDEALSVGDAAFSRKCFAKIEEIRSKGATILFVSHSEGSIVSLCSRAIWIDNGEQIIDGIPKLVTGLYMKNINSKRVNNLKIAQEYQNLLSQTKKTDKKKLSTPKKNNSKQNLTTTSKISSSPIQEYYDPTLKPKSTIYYEEKGAKLFDVEVLTLKGKKVNIITQGNQYIYTYKIKPAYTLNNVQFGFLLKTKNGNPLGGGAFPTKNKYISQISDLTQIKFFFRCTLNNGEYFLNCGTIAEINGKKDYVHRILDAYMIKVINANAQITSNIDFIDKIEVKEKNKK